MVRTVEGTLVDVKVRALGFRAEPSKFHWVAVGGTKDAPQRVAFDEHSAPVGDDEGAALSAHRCEVAELIDRYKPATAWVRSPEFSQFVKRDHLARRSRVEGVIVATLDAHGVKVMLGSLGSIRAKSKAKAPPKKRRKKGDPPEEKKTKKEPTPKEVLAADTFRGIDWSDDSTQIREATWAAVGVIDGVDAVDGAADADRL